jgi:hypothetical protein
VSVGLYSGVSGLALGTGLYKNVSGLWGGASGLIDGFAGTSPFSGASLYLNFLAGAPLDSRITFSRGSNATLVDSTGKITYAPNNLVINSEAFDNASWVKFGTTSVVANAAVAPNGTLTADAITLPSSSGIYRNVASTVGTGYVMSMWLRSDTPQTVRLLSNTDTGVIVSTTCSVTTSWQRFYVYRVAPAGSTTVSIQLDTGGGGTFYAWGAQIEAVTYQTTPSTYNVTTSAAYYGPRFDYDPVTLAAKGLLIEEQRTNLVLRSEEFDNAVWPKVRATISANATTSPDGTVSADKLVEDTTASSTHIIQLQDSFTAAVSGTSYTVSGYAKAGERTSANIQMGSDSGIFAGQNAVFNFSTGVISAQSGTATFAMVNAGNGWYRWSITATALASGAPFIRFQLIGPAGSVTYTGDGTSGLFIWGAQLEAGAFATSYIPTVASQVTRNADVATMTGTNFSSWYNASEGSFVSSYEASPNTFTTYLAASNGVVAQNSMHMDNDGSGNMRVAYYSGSSAVALLTFGAVGTINAVNNVATAYKVNDFAASRNGGTVVTDTAGAVPVSVSQLNIGADPSGAAVNVSNTHIRQIAYYNTRLPNAQLQALTAPSLATTLSLDFINGVYDA